MGNLTCRMLLMAVSLGRYLGHCCCCYCYCCCCDVTNGIELDHDVRPVQDEPESVVPQRTVACFPASCSIEWKVRAEGAERLCWVTEEGVNDKGIKTGGRENLTGVMPQINKGR